MLVSFLNQRLESTHVQSFNHHYKHALVFRSIMKQKGSCTIDEFKESFEQSLEISDKDQGEYKSQLGKEMSKFNGKNQNDGTESDRSSLTYQTNNSKREEKERDGSAGSDFQRGL